MNAVYKNAVCYHHNDMDGKCAGYIIHKMLEGWGIPHTPLNFFSTGYNSRLKTDDIDNGTIVFFVDLSFTPETFWKLEEVAKKAGTVVWIDHHLSSEKLIIEHKERVAEIKNMISFINSSACGAKLCYIFSKIPKEIALDTIGKINPFYFTEAYSNVTLTVFSDEVSGIYNTFTGEIPKYLFYVDDHDRFVHADPDTEMFIFGTDIENTALTVESSFTPTGRTFNPFWGNLSTNEKVLDTYISNGRLIKKYKVSQYAREMSSCFEIVTTAGERILCKNGRGNSYNFNEKIEEYDAVCIFSYSGRDNKWIHSIYSYKTSQFDCEAFAKQFYGGGGHLHAAGWSTDTPILVECFQNDEGKWVK